MAFDNNTNFMGRLTREPELKQAGQSTVVNFTLARNRYTKDKDHPVSDFINFVAWNKVAENIAAYFKKGDRMGVSGELQSRKYTDNNGVDRTVVEVLVTGMPTFIEKKTNNSSSSAQVDDVQPREQTPPAASDVDDDDLPF
jgi:single-strand DNA-binding protein